MAQAPADDRMTRRPGLTQREIRFRDQDRRLSKSITRGEARDIARDIKRNTRIAALEMRRREIVRLRKHGMMWRDIGARYGVTRQRAQQIGTRPPFEISARKGRLNYSWRP